MGVGGGGKKKQAVFEGGGQNTDPQSMDYPKMDYATEVKRLGLGD